MCHMSAPPQPLVTNLSPSVAYTSMADHEQVTQVPMKTQKRAEGNQGLMHIFNGCVKIHLPGTKIDSQFDPLTIFALSGKQCQRFWGKGILSKFSDAIEMSQSFQLRRKGWDGKSQTTICFA